MNAKIIVAFILGAAAGVASSMFYFKTKYEQKADAEIQEIRDLYAKKTEGGQRCGWVYDPNGPTHQISFGIDDYTVNHGKNIMDDGIWIDFNVDGDIMNKVVW